MEQNSNCHVELYQKPFNELDVSEISKSTLAVRGMGCHNCAIRVRNAILRLDGVQWVDIDLETGKAIVAYNAAVISPQQFIPAVAAAGNDGHHNYQAQHVA
jgi:copper chaperone CopZ